MSEGTIVLLALAGIFVAGTVLGGFFVFFSDRIFGVSSPRHNRGEARVVREIRRCCPQPFHVLNNVTLKTDSGTTQIDHILVASFGIVVIETKCYQGWIFGDAGSKNWTQVIYRFKKGFPNPIRQNHGHILALRSLFNLPDGDFHNLVIFAGDAKLKSDMGQGVITIDQFQNYLENHREVVFDERKIAYIVGRIEMQRLPRSLETDEYHINSLISRLGRRG